MYVTSAEYKRCKYRSEQISIEPEREREREREREKEREREGEKRV